MVNMTFNQYQKTLHLSYHTCMYLKVDISIVRLGSVRLMSLLKQKIAWEYYMTLEVELSKRLLDFSLNPLWQITKLILTLKVYK